MREANGRFKKIETARICCQLSVVSYLLSVICYLLSVIRYPLSVIRYPLSVICYLLSVISVAAGRWCGWIDM
jgi:hypothetical protein